LAQAQTTYPYQDAELGTETRVADLLARMSTEEKVAQMRIFHANKGVVQGANGEVMLSDDVKTRLEHGIAGIKNPGEHLKPVEAASINNALQRAIIKRSQWGIPALFVTEAYNGVDAAGSTYFGRPITTAASFDTALVRDIWDVVGREARLRGMHMCHSPEADLVRDPRFGRMSEAFGEDTHLTTEMVVAAITGVQGDYDGLAAGTHIGAVVKHFAGYGQVEGGTNFAAIQVSPRQLEDELFTPFEAAVQRAKTLGVMASHGDLNGVASHGNPWLLTEVLRDRWGFDGYLVSDANDIARLNFFMRVAETPEDAALLGLRAGMDVDLYSEDAYSLLPVLATQHDDVAGLIDRSAARVLRTKFRLGLFDHPYTDIAAVASGVRTPDALALARRADLESVILLKNEAATLPLALRPVRTVALLGPTLSDSAASQFSRVLGQGVNVNGSKGWSLTDEKHAVPSLTNENSARQGVSNLLAKAREADVVILYLGGDEHTAKEAFFNNALGDRASLEPLGPQTELLRGVRALGKQVIVVLKHRRTLAINAFAAGADAILDCWDLSEFGDEAIAKLIFGQAVPSGKLPVTVPHNIGQLPFHYSVRPINERKGYLFQENGPLFPFGHGLSYVDFSYSPLRLSAKQVAIGNTLTAEVDVTNQGERNAKEVVQLYLTDLFASVTRPNRELKAFRKIELAPGEQQTVRFDITPEMLEFTGVEMKKIIEPGEFRVVIGGSSVGGKEAVFRVVE